MPPLLFVPYRKYLSDWKNRDYAGQRKRDTCQQTDVCGGEPRVYRAFPAGLSQPYSDYESTFGDGEAGRAGDLPERA